MTALRKNHNDSFLCGILKIFRKIDEHNIIRKVVDVKAINQQHYLVQIKDCIIYKLFIFH